MLKKPMIPQDCHATMTLASLVIMWIVDYFARFKLRGDVLLNHQSPINHRAFYEILFKKE